MCFVYHGVFIVIDVLLSATALVCTRCFIRGVCIPSVYHVDRSNALYKRCGVCHSVGALRFVICQALRRLCRREFAINIEMKIILHLYYIKRTQTPTIKIILFFLLQKIFLKKMKIIVDCRTTEFTKELVEEFISIVQRCISALSLIKPYLQIQLLYFVKKKSWFIF